MLADLVISEPANGQLHDYVNTASVDNETHSAGFAALLR